MSRKAHMKKRIAARRLADSPAAASVCELPAILREVPAAPPPFHVNIQSAIAGFVANLTPTPKPRLPYSLRFRPAR